MLTISSVYPSDVGTHSLTMTAFYSSWFEPTPPTVTASETIKVEIEELCIFESYIRDQAVTFDAQHEHVLLDGTPAPFEFSFVYEPASCKVDQYYKIMVDNQEMEPPWLKLDSTVHPPTVQILNDDVSYAGVYSVSIFGYLNTIPAFVSADQARFVVTLNLE